MLVLRDFAGLNMVAFEKNAFPWLLGGGLILRGCEQRDEVMVPHNRDSPGGVQVLVRTCLVLHAHFSAGIAYRSNRHIPILIMEVWR